MPSSSCSSRINAASGVSPGWILPPGNSHNPAKGLPAGRSASRTRPSVSISATQTTVTPAVSAPVAAIDVDVAVRQVAGPDGPAAAADAEIDRQPDVAAGHVPRHRRLVVARNRAALGGDGYAANGNRQPVAIGLFTGLADGHDDAAPIGVAGGNRRFDQRRIADSEANPPRRAGRDRARDVDGDEFFRAFAVAHDLLRQID